MTTTQRHQLTPTAWAHVSKGQEGRQQLASSHMGRDIPETAVWPGLVNSIKCKLRDSAHDVLDDCPRGLLRMS